MSKYNFQGAQGNFQIESSGTQNNISTQSIQQVGRQVADALEAHGGEDAARVATELRDEAAKPSGSADRAWMREALNWAKDVVPALAPIIASVL